MKNIKNFKEFRALNESSEMSVKDHANRMMNILYGMDEKYEEDIAVSYNEKERQIKLVLDNVEEVSNISKCLTDLNYNISVKDLEITVNV